MLPFLNAYPVANGPELGNGLAQFNAGFSNPSSLDATSLRVDHAINSKLNLFGRYNYSPSSLVQRGPLVNPALVLSMTEPVTSAVQTGTIGLTELITPAIANEARANYSNQRVGTSYTMDNFGGAVPLPNSLLFPPGYSPSNGVFSLYIAGAGEYVVGHQATSEQRQVNLVDNLSVIKSGHQLKFGVDYRWLAPFVSPFSYREFAEFTGLTATPGGALSGTAAEVGIFSDQANALLAQNFSFYGQDTWKITSRFTATYGLRWDIRSSRARTWRTIHTPSPA